MSGLRRLMYRQITVKSILVGFLFVLIPIGIFLLGYYSAQYFNPECTGITAIKTGNTNTTTSATNTPATNQPAVDKPNVTQSVVQYVCDDGTVVESKSKCLIKDDIDTDTVDAEENDTTAADEEKDTSDDDTAVKPTDLGSKYTKTVKGVTLGIDKAEKEAYNDNCFRFLSVKYKILNGGTTTYNPSFSLQITDKTGEVQAAKTFDDLNKIVTAGQIVGGRLDKSTIICSDINTLTITMKDKGEKSTAVVSIEQPLNK